MLGPSRPLRIQIPSIKVQAYIHGVGLDQRRRDRHARRCAAQRGRLVRRGPDPRPVRAGDHRRARGHQGQARRSSTACDELKPGAKIEITRRDSTVAVFEVNSVERFGKEQLPVDRIYDDYSRPGLRLITCGGRWVGGELGYADNVVVFASLVSAHKA